MRILFEDLLRKGLTRDDHKEGIMFQKKIRDLGALCFLGLVVLGSLSPGKCSFPDEENSSTWLNKRPQRSVSEKDLGQPYRSLKRQKRDHTDQVHKLSRKNEHTTGQECARVRWVETLDCYYSSSTPSKETKIPSEVHATLQEIGKCIKKCDSFYKGQATLQNVLVPHVSYVVQEGPHRRFIPGGFLTIPPCLEEGRSRESKPLFFVSGCEDWSLQQAYTTHRHKFSAGKELPLLQGMGGRYLGKITRQDFSSLPKEEKHTEKWLHAFINGFPESVLAPLEKKGPLPQKLHAIVVDMYSMWDVCNNCQRCFRKEHFRHDLWQKVGGVAQEWGLELPRHGLKVVYRVSSQRPYGTDFLSDEVISRGGGGYDPQRGFDIKAIDQSQVTLATRIRSSNMKNTFSKSGVDQKRNLPAPRSMR